MSFFLLLEEKKRCTASFPSAFTGTGAVRPINNGNEKLEPATDDYSPHFTRRSYQLARAQTGKAAGK